MKFNYKKIATVIGSVLMVGSTVGMAAAANYPTPFVSSGVGDYAVVYGASAATLDMGATTKIAENLKSKVTATGTVTPTGGDSYKLEKSSTKFHVGDAIADVVSLSVTDDNLPTLLKDGKFVDNDNDEFDYTQKVTLGNHVLTMFDDNDYKADTPTLGIKINSNVPVLNYTLDFTDQPLWADMQSSDLTLMGKTYYVLSAVTNTSLTLLDAAESTILSEGETKTLTVEGKTYEVSINFISGTEVKLSVNGEVTNSIAELQTFKLSDGSYIGIKDINSQDYAGGTKMVEFSIGKGKLLLTDGAEVEINDDAISDLTINMTNANEKISAIKIIWAADDELFVTEDSEITMPGFGVVKLSFGGVNFPLSEKIAVEADGDKNLALKNFPLKDSTETIDLLWYNETSNGFNLIGKDEDQQLRTGTTAIIFDADTDEYFVASWSDGNDAESYLMRATSFTVSNNINKTTIQYKKDGTWTDAKSDAEAGDDVTIGNVELNVDYINEDGKAVNISQGTTSVNFNTLYSKEGMKVYLPLSNGTNAVGSATGAVNLSYDTANATSTWKLSLVEEDKDGDKALGENINVTAGVDSNEDVSITGITFDTTDAGTNTEVGSSDVYQNFIYSALATEMMWDKSGDQYSLELTYHGDETMADVYVTSPAVTIIADTGVMTFKDSEVTSFSGKNLVVVGGSCVNAVAAKILGSETPVCGEAFTALTQVGAGQFIVKVADNPYTAGKVAMLVAGFEAEDTAKAATYVTTETVDTTVGKSEVKTTSAVAGLA